MCPLLLCALLLRSLSAYYTLTPAAASPASPARVTPSARTSHLGPCLAGPPACPATARAWLGLATHACISCLEPAPWRACAAPAALRAAFGVCTACSLGGRWHSRGWAALSGLASGTRVLAKARRPARLGAARAACCARLQQASHAGAPAARHPNRHDRVSGRDLVSAAAPPAPAALSWPRARHGRALCELVASRATRDRARATHALAAFPHCPLALRHAAARLWLDSPPQHFKTSTNPRRASGGARRRRGGRRPAAPLETRPGECPGRR